MSFLHRKSLAHALAAIGLAFASLAAQADTASITRNGGFAFDHEVHSFDLDIASASDLRLWTTAFAAGQVDPVLAPGGRQRVAQSARRQQLGRGLPGRRPRQFGGQQLDGARRADQCRAHPRA